MRLLEERAFEKDTTPEDLMEKAGRGIAAAIMRRYPAAGEAVACIGSGNNGGDALVALKYLARAGWSVSVRCAVDRNNLRALPRKKWRELEGLEGFSDSKFFETRLILDGLLGIGGFGSLRDPLASEAGWINSQGSSQRTIVVAMDIPSGVNGDTGEPSKGAVVADLTLTVGVPKQGLLMPAAVNHAGSIETIPLAELPLPEGGDLRLSDRHSLSGLLSRRPHDFHKGNAGRVGVIAGSRGMLGAAVLCSTAAMRAGAGLVTLFCEQENYPLLAPMLPPEVMIRPVKSLTEIEVEKFDAFAIGPGLGMQSGDEGFVDLLRRIEVPFVLDADGLNRIASLGVEEHLRSNMVLTPHPGEMQRLFPESENMNRLDVVRKFRDQFPDVCLLFKGARSLIAKSGEPVFVNGSGNAGMASGGQGDVLTGVIASLLGQGSGQGNATRLGAWLCGRSAEIAIHRGKQSEQSLLASDVIEHLGQAFCELD
ncbi:MAG: NAD(P)H-hydrate dehydratase [Akkermansiaceae bacterium]